MRTEHRKVKAGIKYQAERDGEPATFNDIFSGPNEVEVGIARCKRRRSAVLASLARPSVGGLCGSGGSVLALPCDQSAGGGVGLHRLQGAPFEAWQAVAWINSAWQEKADDMSIEPGEGTDLKL